MSRICRTCCKPDQVVVIAAPAGETSASIFGQPVAFALPGETARFSFSYCQRCDRILDRPALVVAPQQSAVIAFSSSSGTSRVGRSHERRQP